ncbi:putative Ubiquitin carboxyl-terminal hydrolase [Blattamonas nauphoetae]|uniref:Ubiquitin carboxyl-terminal hydrolase n=1 Tax=Blattamonas nauphoetae TaxID=2049346 RepID=A0ABQ9YCE5_9EUKA|nr:putative Ubiquitin carboxyl-terminal hydrolase [Blattamonas nauphoetae]
MSNFDWESLHQFSYAHFYSDNIVGNEQSIIPTSRSYQGFNRKKLFIPQQNPFGTFLASFNQFESSDTHLLNSPPFLPISRSEQISVRLHVLSDLLKSTPTVPDDDEFVPLLSLLSTPEQLSTTSQRTLSSIFVEVISVRIRNQKGQAAFVIFDTITDILLTLLGRLPDSPKESVPLSFITDFLEKTNNFLHYSDCNQNALGFRKDGREGSTARNPLNPTILMRTIRSTDFDHNKGFDLIQKLFDSQSSFDVLVKEGIVKEMISWSEELLNTPDTTHAFEHQNAEQTFRLFNRICFAIISHSHSNVRRGEFGTLVQTLRNNKIKLDDTNAQFLEISLSEIPKDKSQQFVHALTRDPKTTLWGPLFLEQNIAQTISSLNHHATENDKWMEEFINSEGLVRFVIHLIQLLLSEAPLDQEVPFTTRLLRSSRQNSPNFHSSLSSSNSLLDITSIDSRNKRDSGGLILLWTLSSVLLQHLINGTPTILRPTFSQRVSVLPFTLEKTHTTWKLLLNPTVMQSQLNRSSSPLNHTTPLFHSIISLPNTQFNKLVQDRSKFATFCSLCIVPELFFPPHLRLQPCEFSLPTAQISSTFIPIFSRTGFLPLESHQQSNIVPILKKSNVSLEMLLVCVSVLCVLPRRLFDIPRSFENGVVESIADHLNTNPDHHPTGIRLITFLSHLVLSWENIRIPVVPIRRILVNAPTMGNEMLPLRLITSFLLTLIKTGKGWNQTILNQIGNDFVDHILHSFLFPSGSQSLHPIFEDDRMILTELVMALSQPAALVPFFEEKQILMNRLPLPFLDQKERGRENNTIISRNTPKGLRNPRMACFMNAIVIQLFQNKEFSNTILSFDGRVSTTPFNQTPHPSGMTLVDEEIKKQQRMMEESCQVEKDRIPQSLVFFHLQRIFALLCLNREGEVRVTDLAAALSDSSKQMFHENSSNDSEDFVKALLSQLDIFFHRCGYPHFASTSFGCHVVKAMNCENNHPCSTLIDPDFMFPVEIQQSSSLEDALEKMVLGKKGSTLQCLQCVPDGSQMVPGSVRKLIATPSNSVMIFMNRKTLDGQLTTNRCSFPKTLDLFPFSLEKQEVKDADRTLFVYELTGFEVYEVRNDTNHYYSVIKEGRSQMWWLFNDDKVSEFDISKMSDYFGGNGRQGYATLLFYRRLLPDDDGSVNSPVLLPSSTPLGNLLSDEEERYAAEQALKRKLPSSEGQVDEEMQQEWDRTFPKPALSETEERQLERDFLTTTGLDLLQFVLNGTENHDSSRTPTNVNSNVNISQSVSRKGSGKKKKLVTKPNSNVIEPEIIPHHRGTPLTLPLLQAFFHQYVHSGRRSERIWKSIDRTLEKDEQLSRQFVDYLLRQLVEEDEALKNEQKGEEERRQLFIKWNREEDEARQAHEEEQDRILRAFEQKIHEMEVNTHEPTQRNNRFKNRADRSKVERERPQRIPFSKKVLPSSSIIRGVHHTTSLLVSFFSDCQDQDVVNRFLSTFQICIQIIQPEDLELLLDRTSKAIVSPSIKEILDYILSKCHRSHYPNSNTQTPPQIKNDLCQIVQNNGIVEHPENHMIPHYPPSQIGVGTGIIEHPENHMIPHYLPSRIGVGTGFIEHPENPVIPHHPPSQIGVGTGIIEHPVNPVIPHHPPSQIGVGTGIIEHPENPVIPHHPPSQIGVGTGIIEHPVNPVIPHHPPSQIGVGTGIVKPPENHMIPHHPPSPIGVNTGIVDQHFKSPDRQSEIAPFIDIPEDQIVFPQHTPQPSRNDFLPRLALFLPFQPFVISSSEYSHFSLDELMLPSDASIHYLRSSFETLSTSSQPNLQHRIGFEDRLLSQRELFNSIVSLLIDPTETAQNPSSAVRVSSDLIRLNEELKFIQPCTVDLILNCLIDQMTSVSAISMNASIFQLLLLLMVSFDEEILGLRSKIAELILDRRMRSLLTFKLPISFLRRQPMSVDQQNRLFAMYFSLVLNILIIVSDSDPQVSHLIADLHIDTLIKKHISDINLNTPLQILNRFLSQTLLAQEPDSTILQMLEEQRMKRRNHIADRLVFWLCPPSSRSISFPSTHLQSLLSQHNLTQLVISTPHISFRPNNKVDTSEVLRYFFEADEDRSILENRQLTLQVIFDSLKQKLDTRRRRCWMKQFGALMKVISLFFIARKQSRTLHIGLPLLHSMLQIYGHYRMMAQNICLSSQIFDGFKFIVEQLSSFEIIPPQTLGLLQSCCHSQYLIFPSQEGRTSLIFSSKTGETDLRPSFDDLFSFSIFLIRHSSLLPLQSRIELWISLCSFCIVSEAPGNVLSSISDSELHTFLEPIIHLSSTLASDRQAGSSSLHFVLRAFDHLLVTIGSQALLDKRSLFKNHPNLAHLSVLSLLFSPPIFTRIFELFVLPSDCVDHPPTTVRPLSPLPISFKLFFTNIGQVLPSFLDIILQTVISEPFFAHTPQIYSIINHLQFIPPHLFAAAKQKVANSDSVLNLIRFLSTRDSPDSMSACVIIRRIFYHSELGQFIPLTKDSKSLTHINTVLRDIHNKMTLYFSLTDPCEGLLENLNQFLNANRQALQRSRPFLMSEQSNWHEYRLVIQNSLEFHENQTLQKLLSVFMFTAQAWKQP